MARPRLLRRPLRTLAILLLAGVAGLYTCVPTMPIFAMPRRGRVLDMKTKEPIAGALVFLTYTIVAGGGTVETRWTMTDSEGRFSFGPKLFPDIGERTALFPRRPDAVVHHKSYDPVVAGFDHSGYQLPGYENPIEMLSFDDDQRNLRIDPRGLYQDPAKIQTLCAGLMEAACEQACQWAYGLPAADCRRLRRTQ